MQENSGLPNCSLLNFVKFNREYSYLYYQALIYPDACISYFFLSCKSVSSLKKICKHSLLFFCICNLRTEIIPKRAMFLREQNFFFIFFIFFKLWR